MEYRLVPVGKVHNKKSSTEIEIFPEYRDALDGLREGQLIWLILWFHRSDDEKKRKIMKVHSHGEPGYPLRGIFATRSPVRPNPIALYRRRILKLENSKIFVRYLDAYEDTPVIDIKPYSATLDNEE